MLYRVLVACLIGLLAAGCGDSHESAMDDSLDLLEEMAVILEGIGSADDVEAASQKITKLGDEFAAIQERMDDLGKATEEQNKEFAVKFQNRMMEVMTRVQKAAEKTAKYPEIEKAFSAAMSRAGSR